MDVITSRDNSLLQRARSTRDGKVEALMFVEGLRLCEEALISELPIEAVIYSEEIARKQRAREFLEKVTPVAERVAAVSEKLLSAISYTKTPQGIVVLAARPRSDVNALVLGESKPPLIVLMHNINNPVNVGAILRTAEAAGATGVIATSNTSDPFSPKALRGAMGSAFRLPIWFKPSYEEAIAWCRTHDIRTICADVRADAIYTGVDWKQSSALILGPESSGLSDEERAAATQSVAVPMQGAVDSLNVAVTAGVLLYEAARQRQRFN